MVRLRQTPNILPSLDETAIVKNGSDCSGTEGVQGRVLTLDNTSLTTSCMVFVNGRFLHLTNEYTVSHLAANSTITFLIDVWNDDLIGGYYFT